MIRPTRRIPLILGLLALWLQLLAPTLAMSAGRSAAPSRFAICHAATAGDARDHDGSKVPHTPACEHCVLCHAVAAGALLEGQPVFTLFDYPVSSPLRWSALSIPPRKIAPRRDAQPRGPPILA